MCGINFYLSPAQPFWPLWGVYSYKLFLTINIKLNFMLIKVNWFLVQYSYIENSYIRQMCGSFILVCKLLLWGEYSFLLTPIHSKGITHQAVNIWWCIRTHKMHTTDNNSTSPYEWKKTQWQICFMKNERLERKTSDTRVSLRYCSTFYRRHT